jgi:hypothetical protein
MTPNSLRALHQLLVRRLAIIADQALRERDPAAQLDQLREVSEAITAWHDQHRAECGARLNHFLAGASLEKARLWVEEALQASA